MKLYISGPITGLPDCNHEAFMDAEKRLRDVGYEVINPTRTTPGPDAARHDYMRSAIRQIADADGLAQLEGWNHSPRGAYRGWLGTHRHNPLPRRRYGDREEKVRMATYSMGSLFTGYGGLDMGVADALGPARLAWVCDVGPGPCRLLAARHPGVPNLGDITEIDWGGVEPVDVLVGGSPCQDLSLAGGRAGMRPGTQSGLWESMMRGIVDLRPHLVVWENVIGALSASASSLLESRERHLGIHGDRPVIRGAGRVVGDLSTHGYDAWWTVVRACDVAAPHRRARLFLVAADSHRDPWHERWAAQPAQATLRQSPAEPSRRDRERLKLLPTPTASQMDGRKSSGFSGSDSFYDIVERGHGGFAPYAPAIRQWETVTRKAPSPLDDGKLSTRFVEWMMGLKPGWVTAPRIGLSRSEQLRALGNGVVPQQAAYAIHALATIARENTETVA